MASARNSGSSTYYCIVADADDRTCCRETFDARTPKRIPFENLRLGRRLFKRSELLLLTVIAIAGIARGQESGAPVPATAPVITISPLAATLRPGGRMKFSVSFQPSQSGVPSVTWSVNERVGGDKVLGKISTDGLYIAPPATLSKVPVTLIPIPLSTVTVTASYKADPSVTASATIVFANPCYVGGAACVQIAEATRRFVPASSFLVSVGKTLSLTAKGINFPNSSDAPITWTVNDGKNDKDVVGRIKSTGNKTANYCAPHSVPPVSVTITAKAGSFSSTASIILVAPRFTVRCSRPKDAKGRGGCTVNQFDRLAGKTGTISDQPVNGKTDAGEVTAINSSKAVFSGSVLSIDLPTDVNNLNCSNYDWKMVVQAEESAGIFIYNPTDIGSGICEGKQFIIALPVHVVWAEIYGFQQNLDPTRTAPAKPSGYTDCLGQNAPQTISPCDKHTFWFTSVLYQTGWLYRHLTPPGTAQGTISLTPVIGQGPRQLSFDITANPSYKVGIGWISIPLTFEKSTTLGTNLDALIFGVAYDFRWLRNPNFIERSSFVLRKLQFEVRSGPEIAPTTPHDLNLVESETGKLPFVFNFHQQPSFLTIYPVVGLEEGSHFVTHLTESGPLFRGLAGLDGSVRWPFIFTHNFLGSTPITLDYSYRMRWLAYDEPTTDVANNGSEVLSRQRRSYFRSSLIAPLNPYIQFSTTLLRGSLPPDFKVITTTLTLGLTFSNPGSAEH